MSKKHYILVGAIFLLAIIILIAVFTLRGPNISYKNPPSPDGIKEFDVIVYGSEPEGISAAVSAARSDLDVLLITEDEEVGGLMTLGRLNFIDMNYDDDGTLLTRGLFKEFYDEVGGNAFEIDNAIKVFRKMLKEEDVYLKSNIKLDDVIKENSELIGLTVNTTNDDTKDFTAKRIIDASADADLAAKAGVPYIIAGEDINHDDRPMGVTLIFELENVNWPKMFFYLNSNRVLGQINEDYRREWGSRFNTAWGYTKKGHAYEPNHEDIIIRGLNVARQQDNRSLINCLLIVDIDPLSEESRTKAKKAAKEELKDLVPYFRENLPGFENAELAEVADELYVRESRYIKGEYTLTINDVLGNRDHHDRVAIGGYPVDIQPTRRRRTGVVVGAPDRYSIPFRSLVPKEIDNLLVVGRSASFSSLAGGSTRVIPVGMSTAEAAGVASYYSIDNETPFRDIAYNEDIMNKIQDELTARGAYLESFEREDPLQDHPAFESIKTLRKLGVLYGGYENNYRLDEPITRGRFSSILNTIIKNTDLYEEIGSVNISEDDKVYSELVLEKVLMPLGKEYENIEIAIDILNEKDILPSDLNDRFEKERVPKSEEVFIILANLYDYLEEKK
ncbi:FAD-dependent oxidoreductase [Natranaerofaba carboxydovora]|uniref:FAD-dependent oxidoreductase n=1 Tax=Natranaerofaba carboxydovora TaxID=2742683 RepID=UPI001F149202|nr:FAD-dependent oxidoreductase [Natranaerofaba carboxydovora]UMZ75090.1 FAD dependent oxidoreductase [Natranaerofaba carboxydovora]